MTTLIENTILITPFEELRNSALLFDDQGLIVSLGETPSSLNEKVIRVDAGGRYLIPGLIDMHVHGGFWRFFRSG
jgi:Imidazolonepropionase and related amidohydrolases